KKVPITIDQQPRMEGRQLFALVRLARGAKLPEKAATPARPERGEAPDQVAAAPTTQVAPDRAAAPGAAGQALPARTAPAPARRAGWRGGAGRGVVAAPALPAPDPPAFPRFRRPDDCKPGRLPFRGAGRAARGDPIRPRLRAPRPAGPAGRATRTPPAWPRRR